MKDVTSSLRRFDTVKFFAAIIISFLPGIIGSSAVIQSVDTWYVGLQKPVFNPPNWVFGPVWTVLYFMMGISFYIIWTKKAKIEDKTKAIALFGFQLILNGLWSFLFFGLRIPLVALFEILVLWFILSVTIRTFNRISTAAAVLLVPYFIWVSFAMLLNAAIVLLN